MGTVILMSFTTTTILSILLLIIPDIREFVIDFVTASIILIPLALFIYIISNFLISSLIVFPIMKSLSYDVVEIKETKTYTLEENIKSLQLNKEASASNTTEEAFSLGINQTPTGSYFYFFAEEKAMYKLKKVDADYTYIKETDAVDPKITTDKKQETLTIKKTPTSFGKLLKLDEVEEKTILSEKTENIIYIPVGSLIENYNPGLNN